MGKAILRFMKDIPELEFDYSDENDVAEVITYLLDKNDKISVLTVEDNFIYEAETIGHAVLYIVTLALSDKVLLEQIRLKKTRRDFAVKLLYFVSEILGEDIDIECLRDVGISREDILASRFDMEEFVQEFGLEDVNDDLPYSLNDNIELNISCTKDEYGVVVDGISAKIKCEGELMCDISIENAVQVYMGISTTGLLS